MRCFEADLLAVIIEDVRVEGVAVDADTELLMSGLVDSLGIIRIVEWIEGRLSIVIDPADVVLENFESVANIVAFLASHPQVAPAVVDGSAEVPA